MDFVWFMIMFMNPFVLLGGLLLGATWALHFGPIFYRVYRRRRLHKGWKTDSPRTVRPTLEPRFDEYDPDEPGVDRRCVCHRRKIPRGEHVLLWPETGQLGLTYVAVYCAQITEPHLVTHA